MKIRKMLSGVLLCGIVAITGCGLISADTPVAESVETPAMENVYQAPGPDSYDSADTAVLVKKDSENDTVTLFNLDVGKQYTLYIVGTTTLTDRHGTAVSLEQIQPGDVVDVTFLKSQKRLNSMMLSENSWSNESVSKYTLNFDRNNLTIGEERFKITDDTLFFSEGRQIEEMDINERDVLSFQGIGNQVVSVVVEKGHGYLRLNNDENFIGGFIEIGQTMVQQITDDMLLTVPEGDYEVNISCSGGGGVKNISIDRGEEVVLDIGDLEVAEEKFGQIIFSLTPPGTELYVDGAEIDASQPVSLSYGIHQVIARADNYQSITTYLKVGQASAGIDIVLEPVGSDDDEKDDDSQSSENTIDASSGYYKVYVEAPEGAEVYVDGNYIGISPVNFKKEEGSHVITLRKSGYETRSYTISVDAEEKDISFSFAELVEESLTE
ncbi:MAG: PEGA domain-containing protein [Lachnospiraceae bacterium]|nr:PEGA domain-containing protein [Lachnospiraceae bacterium]